MTDPASAAAAEKRFREGAEAEERGEPVMALDCYLAALALDPGRIDARVNAGLLERTNGRCGCALHHHLVALALEGGHPLVLLNCGESAAAAGLQDDAEWLLERCLGAAPHLARAREALDHVRGAGAAQNPPAGDMTGVVACYAKALIHSPQSARLWLQLADAYMQAEQFFEAADASFVAQHIEPDNAAAWAKTEGISRRLGRRDRAIQALLALTRLAPDNATIWNNLGAMYIEKGAYADAAPALERAVAIDLASTMARRNLGFCLERMGKPEAALQIYEEARKLDPTDIELLVHSIAAGQSLCDWRDFEAKCLRLRDMLASEHAVTGPFPLVAIPHIGPDLQLACAQKFVARLCPAPAVTKRALRAPRERMRVGFVSGELRAHATGFLIAEVIEQFDPARIETWAFSTSTPEVSPTRARLEKAFGHFHDISRLTDEDGARFIASCELDALIDLNVFTGTMRLGLFSPRPAPIQINYLGFPGTSGAPFFDYIIADETIIPPGSEQHYSERVLRMPVCYQPNDRKRPLPTPASRASQGLPEDAVVLANMNSVYKLTPAMFDVWCTLLRRYDAGILWTLSNGSSADRNLLAEAERRGVGQDRIVFAPRAPLDVHMARLPCANLLLDTSPCNGHTTVSDALWCGVPVVTLMGDTFAGRVAASLLRAAGAPELVATTLADYEALAASLIQRPSRLSAHAHALRTSRTTTPLFDSKRYAADFETLLSGAILQG